MAIQLMELLVRICAVRSYNLFYPFICHEWTGA
jgi:hypothetical protein